MNTDQYKTQLEEEKTKLTEELSSFAVKDEAVPGDWDAVRNEDPSDSTSQDEVADELEDMSERKATEEPLEQRLAKVNLALEKIEQGRYGICEISGEAIEEDRLAADPAARTCKEHVEEEDNLTL